MNTSIYVIIINNQSRGVNDQFILTIKKEIKNYKNANILTKLLLTNGTDIQAVLNKALSYKPTVLVACGGDGTVKTVAELAINNNIKLAIIPAGTLNHFAKELQLPIGVQESMDYIYKNNKIFNITVGNVNGNIFLNNSSVGVYSQLVIKREIWQQKYNKFYAMFLSALWQIYHIRRYRYTISNGLININGKFSLILIGNGYYFFDKGAFKRSKFKDKNLSLYILSGKNFLQLIKSMIYLVVGKSFKKEVIINKNINNLQITTNQPYIDVALDGEVIKINSPLNYSTYDKKLTVLLPKT